MTISSRISHLKELDTRILSLALSIAKQRNIAVSSISLADVEQNAQLNKCFLEAYSQVIEAYKAFPN